MNFDFLCLIFNNFLNKFRKLKTHLKNNNVIFKKILILFGLSVQKVEGDFVCIFYLALASTLFFPYIPRLVQCATSLGIWQNSQRFVVSYMRDISSCCEIYMEKPRPATRYNFDPISFQYVLKQNDN